MLHISCRWIGIRLETLGNVLILAASLFALLTEGLSGADVGLSITYALQVGYSLIFQFVWSIIAICTQYNMETK